MKLMLLAVILAAASSPVIADAATFTESFQGSGTLAGASFTDTTLDLTGSGSPPSIYNTGGGYFSVQLTSLTVSGLLDSGNAFSAQFSDPFQAFSNPGSDAVGFVDEAIADLADTTSATIAPDLNSSFAATGSLYAYLDQGFKTSEGSFVITSVGNTSTFLENATVSAAPEPSIWAMMIAGVAMVGAMLRFGRRREASLVA